MENKKPFTDHEEKVMTLITEAHNEYCKLEVIHSSATDDWINAIHQLQKDFNAQDC